MEFLQLESWQKNSNSVDANWSHAMEVALRAMNLLAAFSPFRYSPNLNEERLRRLLQTMKVRSNTALTFPSQPRQFSYLATSNHYLSDIAGSLWLGNNVAGVERTAKEWREWALAEIVREMDKQILDDGADYEASTGYHRFVLELFLYSFILCRANEIPIADKYWRKLHAMLVYLRTILRPDGFAPLIGDTDGGQALPVVSRSANDHSYLLTLGAAVFKDSQFKLARLEAPQELLWLLGEEGLRTYAQFANATPEISSQAFSRRRHLRAEA